MMMNKKYILSIFLLLIGVGVSAQKAERSHIRKGNRQFADSAFVDAEVNYRKALETNPQSTVSMYNLGNSLFQQQKAKEAMEQYTSASRIEKNKSKLGQIYHNMGVLLHTGKDYANAIEAYKMALRNNPSDHETRYNLALAQKMLKDQQENQQNQDQNKEQEDKKEQHQEQNKSKQNNSKEQQQPPKSDKKENEMSKENAEQLLNSVMQDEKEIHDKVKKQQQVILGGKLEKDW